MSLTRWVAVGAMAAAAACGGASTTATSTDVRPSVASSSSESTGDPEDPTAAERRAGRVLRTRWVHGKIIAPPGEGAAPVLSREQAWEALKPIAGENVDMSWVLLADFSADVPATDPEKDGDATPLFQHRLAWMLFQFNVPSRAAPAVGGAFCEPAGCTPSPRTGARLRDLIYGLDATTGGPVAATTVTFAPGRRPGRPPG